MTLARTDGRAAGQLRPTRMTPSYTMHAEGSVLIESGRTRVICTASIEDRVPPFLRNTGKGWVTAEYGMLPRATSTRTQREASAGKTWCCLDTRFPLWFEHLTGEVHLLRGVF